MMPRLRLRPNLSDHRQRCHNGDERRHVGLIAAGKNNIIQRCVSMRYRGRTGGECGLLPKRTAGLRVMSELNCLARHRGNACKFSTGFRTES
jgi:hypothetical protein